MSMKALVENKSPLELTAMALALAMAIFHLYCALFGPPDAIIFRALHLCFALVLGFLMSPGPFRPVAILLALLAAAAGLYPIFSIDYINNRMIYVDDLRMADWIFGIMMLVVLVDGTRRAIGWALPLTALVFLAYGVLLTNVGLPSLM
ncbi:MAG: hypothetical protein KDH19_11765, partial [Geminicoccaceae bacterium]|nr:hypothetical protein [Geminicoccaceae bacterium]